MPFEAGLVRRRPYCRGEAPITRLNGAVVNNPILIVQEAYKRLDEGAESIVSAVDDAMVTVLALRQRAGALLRSGPGRFRAWRTR